MKILVFGKTGQVATEISRQADVVAIGRDEADLADPVACADMIARSDVDAVINAAAYTAVDKAEDDSAMAQTINGDAPAAMAVACAARGIPFVHISTDYVFDGSGDVPWKPADACGPLGVYGQTKRAGEDGVRAAGGNFAILRTSWVFSAHGGNFVKTMLRLGKERDSLAIVADQIGGPTAAADIAAACLKIAIALQKNAQLSGTYHFSGAPDVSWADFAREIFAQSMHDVRVQNIPTSDYPTPAARPANSRLDNGEITRAFAIKRPDWRLGLASVLSELSR